ncbi:MAG: hypothetical protein ACI4HK_01820 [Ruminococcus sp.]
MAEEHSKPVKTKDIVFNIITFLLILVAIHLLYYPYEQHFMTFSSEESALNYVSKDISKLERYETDDAIFYVERTKDFDKLFSITKLDDKYSFVNYNCQVDIFDINKRPVALKTIYNKNTDTTFYNLDIMKKQPFDKISSDTPTTVDDLSMTYSTTFQKDILYKYYDTFCFYTFGKGAPNDKINITAGENNRTVYITHYSDIPIISEREREF